MMILNSEDEDNNRVVDDFYIVEHKIDICKLACYCIVMIKLKVVFIYKFILILSNEQR